MGCRISAALAVKDEHARHPANRPAAGRPVRRTAFTLIDGPTQRNDARQHYWKPGDGQPTRTTIANVEKPPAACVYCEHIGVPRRWEYTPMTCRPGHAPKWPDWEPGNVAAVKHGVFRRDRAVIVAEEVEQLAEETAQRFAWTVGYEDERRADARARG